MRKGHEKLRLKMFSMGYNITKLADEMGVSNESLSAKLRGESSFKWWEVAKICRILDLKNPLNWFDCEEVKV